MKVRLTLVTVLAALCLTACNKQKSESKEESADSICVAEQASNPNLIEELPKYWDQHTASAHYIMPLEQELDRKVELTDMDLRAKLSVDDIDCEERSITFTIGLPEVYSRESILNLTADDTLLMEQEELIVSTVNNDDGWIEINCTNDRMFYMSGNEGGSDFTAMSDNDWIFYHDIRKLRYPMAEDFVFIDCDLDPMAPKHTITADQLKDYFKTLEDYRRTFDYNDCIITLQDGQIRKMERLWRP
ncbi:MAG: hypothetical protein KBT12_03915 [Bacteroidales bacterium]|nr:hypothetical protein [Candidatus Physcousia equi]